MNGHQQKTVTNNIISRNINQNTCSQQNSNLFVRNIENAKDKQISEALNRIKNLVIY